ncbi:LysR family transcriptional regulator [Luteibacter flocculans]|uniref:LysR family transcriptional regulator n=1 Tax=Luteibacter flocculans TaxID=2780091 RepID=A0ABY4T9U6_9GAMM|nr:LysR family transcriptional regulator [Luteibacter flocculans]URL60135.1 LysR family transcriptional regulator [Luteibacter flocculans]
MSPDLFPAIAAFACVARHASFTRAAAELGVSPSALSQTVRTLESRLGARLLDRSTRRVGLTEVGQRFLDEAQPALSGLTVAMAAVTETRDMPSGLLRINLPRAIADILILPHLADFQARYPDVVVELHCDNRFVDLVAAGFDAGFRIGESLGKDVVAHPIGSSQRIATFVAPAYARAHGIPATPADLLHHRCVGIRLEHDRSPMRWDYMLDGRLVEVDTRGCTISNDDSVLLAAALAGVGVSCHFESMVSHHLASGMLIPVLQDYWPTFSPFHVYYPSRMHMPRKLRVFIDFLREKHAPLSR